jgi:hypothetical protein
MPARGTGGKNVAPEARVQISGPRLRSALAVSGLSLRDASALLKRQGEARLSVAGLGKMVAAAGTVTTRKSIRDALAVLCGVASDWLSGFGPDRHAVELVAHKLAGRFWDDDQNLKRQPTREGDTAEAVRRLADFVHRQERNRATRERILLDILDLERWVRLLGDPRPAELSAEAKESFALSLARALQIAITQPVEGWRDNQHGSQLRPRSSGLEALRECLSRPAT